MSKNEETVRNIVILIALAVAFPAITITILKSILTGLLLGGIIAIIIWGVYMYLQNKY